jgi:hypothetical protein
VVELNSSSSSVESYHPPDKKFDSR